MQCDNDQYDLSEVIKQNSTYQLPDSNFYKSQVILLGENHGIADIQALDEGLLIHLNKTVGLKYYIAEMDSATAGQLNHFLNSDTKDTSLLKKVVMVMQSQIPQQAGQEYYNKWLHIYDYNKGLDDSLKIKVLGVDRNFSDNQPTVSRDEAMFDNFKRAVTHQHLGNEKFYGLFGYAHTLQTGTGPDNYQSFAARLKTSGFMQPNSIVCYNVDSEIYFPKNDQYPTPEDEKIGFLNADGPLILVKGIKDLIAASQPNTINLFRLNGAQTPYNNGQKLAGVKVNFVGEDVQPHDVTIATSSIFQYVVLVSNGTAVTTLR